MSRDVAPDVGRRILERRTALGLTVPDLAKRLGRDPRRVSEFEREGVGTLRLVAQIARALEMWPGELAFGTPPDGAANDAGAAVFIQAEPSDADLMDHHEDSTDIDPAAAD
jgi:transcriptional regulator with XRE-family HTH domain